MKGLGKHDFGKGPPSTIFSFGDEDTEHKYIKDLEKTGLTTTDIDPIDPNQPKGMKRQKTDPTYNVNETDDRKAAVLKIQKHLNKKYGANLDLDGKLGPLTLKSINKFMPRAKTGLADEPNKTTAVQGKKLKEADKTLGITFTQEPYECWNGMGAMITAYADGDQVGQVIFEPTDSDKNKWYATEVEVEDEFQRRGIATTMYDMAKKIAQKANAVIVPSHAQTSDAKGLWKDKKIWEASGYIPSEKEKNDPRFKTALTVDVKPDSIKKNAKAFNWKTSRAGIPPQARADGKLAEDLMREFKSFLLEDKQPKVGYHVTATKNLPVIRKNGINADRRGNSYVWDTLEMAEWFTDFQNDEGQDRTILKIDMTGIDARPDPEAEDMSEWSSRFEPGTNGGAWIVSGSIPPDKIIG